MDTNSSSGEKGGKSSKAGTAIPRKPYKFSWAAWKTVFKRLKNCIGEHHLTIVAAGVAFYLMLGIVPALGGLIAAYGFFASPEDVQEHFSAVEGTMPEEASSLLREQMDRLSEEESGAGWGAVIGIVLALWAGSRATKALMKGLNITYEAHESRGFIKVAALGLLLTVIAVVLGLLAVGVIAVLPPLLNALPLPEALTTFLSIIRWPLLFLVGVLGITILYNLAPSRTQPRWRWLSWGSGIAAVLWLVASILFSIYVSNFGNYNETYGSLGAVVILLLWLYITALVILLGAEIDIAFEEQTRRLESPDET